ncbi:DUF3095 domain-containing protein [Tritonibacter multivorans]|nr:DUF3095 domain-containing protein [Tritonibacter multivorans]MDA7420281.1 DUF3095 domain-containing protein [Tritonibacter multivorans]
MKDTQSNPDTFYDDLPLFAEFSGLQQDAFTPLPDDWLLGCCDIVDSTALIDRGQFKTVNMIGAAAIAALRNTLPDRAFPFVFGGDGAGFALPPDCADLAARELARLQAWVAQEFAIDLRATLAPVADVRASGQDVRVARFGASRDVDYAMFDGGGLNWLESQMKGNDRTLSTQSDGTPPDLTGLSCRWDSVKARNDMILSVLVKPEPTAPFAAVAEVTQAILQLANGLDRGGHPLPKEGPGFRFPPKGLMLEARLGRGKTAAILRKVTLTLGTALVAVLFWRGRKLGNFDPVSYRAEIAANADFRKYDDGLKLTLDCPQETHDQIEGLLADARAAGLVRYGLFAQDEAMVTCIVPSAMRADHMHFVDGASGGYARAAQMLRAQGK